MVAFRNVMLVQVQILDRRYIAWKQEMVAFHTVMLVQLWCRYKFEIVVTFGYIGGKHWGKQAVVAFRTAMLVQMQRRYKFEIVIALREARDGRFPQCNAGADAVEGSRSGCFSHCNAGADIAQVYI